MPLASKSTPWISTGCWCPRWLSCVKTTVGVAVPWSAKRDRLRFAEAMINRPPALWVFALATVMLLVLGSLATGFSKPLLTLLVAAFGIALSVFVLRGSRFAWSLAVLGGVLYFTSLPFSSLHWWVFVLAVVQIGCLLWPESRRFVWRAAPPIADDSFGQIDRPRR